MRTLPLAIFVTILALGCGGADAPDPGSPGAADGDLADGAPSETMTVEDGADADPIDTSGPATDAPVGDVADPKDDGPPPSSGWIPADRVVQWQGNVGVEGGIPDRTTLRNCVSSDGVPTDGTTDATVAIQNCLKNAPDEGAAFLPTGSYLITATIKIPAKKTLRGAGSVGSATTTIFTKSKIDDLLYIGAGTSAGPLLSITAGHKKGSTSLTLSDASSVAAGNYLLLNEKNDASIPVSPNSYASGEGACTWCDQFGGTRLRAQVVKVKSKTGSVVEITPALVHDFSAANAPAAMKLNGLVERAGIEDLVVKNAGTTGGWNNNVMFMGAANSWIKRVKIDTCGKRCIDARHYYYRLEIRDSLVEHCLDHTNSDTCYGTELAEGSSSLVENNVYHDVSEGPLVMWGASGNVLGYNYAVDVFRFASRTSWFWPTSWQHGAHPSFNLWEGNDMAGLNLDGYWGSSSHNVVFRNRFSSKEPLAGLLPGHVEDAAIIVERNNHYESFAGNVLGLEGWSNKYEEEGTRDWSANLIFAVGTGGGLDAKCRATMFRHQNYDYATKSVKSCGVGGEPPCQGGDGTTTLPSSLYLASKPSWFGSVPFPAIDPVGPTVADIPAKRRWLGK